mgnify:CR=1 FL=1
MIIPQDQLFRDERERYQLRWNCENCAHFAPNGLADPGVPTTEDATEGEGAAAGDDAEKKPPVCVHGFPIQRHRRARYDDPEAELLFCKEHVLD